MLMGELCVYEMCARAGGPGPNYSGCRHPVGEDPCGRCPLAVSLHVRRGDYVSDPKTKAILGVCSLDYYRAAIAHIAERIESPAFFVFSDDIAWAKANLEIPFPCEYVDHNQGQQSYNDMHLMSLCKHHIIANSSFSWWGAWLNPRKDKIVIAPENWFANNEDAKDLIPPESVKL